MKWLRVLALFFSPAQAWRDVQEEGHASFAAALDKMSLHDGGATKKLPTVCDAVAAPRVGEFKNFKDVASILAENPGPVGKQQAWVLAGLFL